MDYLGIATDLKKALSFYSDAGGKGDPTESIEKAVKVMAEKLGSGTADVFRAEQIHQRYFGNSAGCLIIPHLSE